MRNLQICKFCGEEYEANPIGRKSMYCSKQCNYDVQNKKKSEAVKRKIKKRLCEACGQEYMPKRFESGLKYCSRECMGRANNFRQKYGTTVREYNVMFEEHAGRCAICGVHQSQLEKALHIDHCHETGAVRGLLCSRCNRGIGQFKDDPEIVERAIEFLEGEDNHG